MCVYAHIRVQSVIGGHSGLGGREGMLVFIVVPSRNHANKEVVFLPVLAISFFNRGDFLGEQVPMDPVALNLGDFLGELRTGLVALTL